MNLTNLEAEETVLGNALQITDAAATLLREGESGLFSSVQYETLFRSFSRVFESGQAVNLATVTKDLRDNGEEFDPAELARITSRTGVISDFRPALETLKELKLRRELRRSGEALKKAENSDQDPVELLEKAEESLIQSGNVLNQTGSRLASELYQQFIDTQEATESGEINGTRTGLTELDRTISGFMRTDLTVIASRPGMGKTSSLVQFALNLVSEGSVAIFSLEMSALQIYNRLVSNIASVDSSYLRQGGKSPEQWQRLTRAIEDERLSRIYIDDQANLNPLSLRSKAREFSIKSGGSLKAVFIDYLQLMEYRASKESRDEKVAALTRSCKLLAKELDIPIILYSQLNRSVESRGGNKKPNLSDLRESGAIEQDADEVIFLWWPRYYGIREDEAGASLDGTLSFIVAKNRHGAIKEVPVSYKPEFSAFQDLDEGAEKETKSASHTPF